MSTTYSPSVPTCLSHPEECSPSLLDNPSAAPLPFQGFKKRSYMKSQSTKTYVRLPIVSEIFSHMPDNLLLQSSSQANPVRVITSTKSGMGSGNENKPH
jgi:hypothetical protein